MYEISPRFLNLARGLRVEQINNFSKSTMVDFRCLGNEIGRIFAKNWLELGNYEMSLDFSLTRLYKRSWSAILCNGQITAIIRLVKLALLKCFQAYIKRVMRAILVRSSSRRTRSANNDRFSKLIMRAQQVVDFAQVNVTKK